MRRSSGTTLASRGDVPSTSATRRRTELVPMSTAATRFTPAPLRARAASASPHADGVVGAGEQVGVVGVEALHAHARAADPTDGRGPRGRPAIAASRSAA